MIRKTRLLAALAMMTLPVIAIAAAPLYTKAVADPARPAADTARDADRKPAEMLAFAHVKPGQTVVDYMPGKGYFTRLFSAAVGPKGAVYTETPQMMVDLYAKSGHPLPPSVSIEPGRGNVHDIIASGGSFHLPAPADLVWTSQNYHDYPDKFMGPTDPAILDREVLAALKPGGVFVVVDHVAEAGSGERDTEKLHRIDPAFVKTQVVAAGFTFDGESDALHNPADNHTLLVFKKEIRGNTDQFAYRFRKPK